MLPRLFCCRGTSASCSLSSLALLQIAVLVCLRVVRLHLLALSDHGDEQHDHDVPHSSHAKANFPGNKEEGCRYARGKGGIWTANALDGTQQLDAASWTWEDKSRDRCPFALLKTRSDLCSVLRVLRIRRIFLVGDSLTRQLFDTLVGKLGIQYQLPSRFKTTPLQSTFLCEADATMAIMGTNESIVTANNKRNQQPFRVELTFTRNDRLDRNLNVTNKRRFAGEHGISYSVPWLDRYNNTARKIRKSSSEEERTLIIANTGLHVHDSAEFREVFDDFLASVQENVSPADIVWFRTLVPGHKDCGNNVAPFDSYARYESTETTLYDWNLMEEYNDYVKKRVGEQQASKSRARVDLLDVFNMTVLRGDGHQNPPKDCLHYLIPGPIDWWGHLMLSNLRDLALEEQRGDTG